MIPMLKTSWWTFDEILRYPYGIAGISDYVPDEPNTNQLDTAKEKVWFTGYCNYCDLKINVQGLGTISNLNDIINAMMMIVYNRHAYDYIFEKTFNWSDNLVLNEQDLHKVLSKFINVINNTASKYVPMLVLNKDNSNNLIKPMESQTSGSNYFNDTPQNDNRGTGFEDDDHVTNVTNSTSRTTADSGSLMQRLDEVYKNYRSVILDWSNEFNQLFLKEEQL